ncbi:MAG: glutamate 5-kinase [Ruminococcaceae bacterium]|nr:glutamate 5-kinase [Oscillospiraceae bacterium]
MKVVIKIGTSTLTHPTGLLNVRLVEKICKTISDVKNAGHEIILVSSGAIGMGVGKLGLSEKPSDVASKQAAAAVGQCELMYIYDKLFGEYNHIVAQLLITGDDIENPVRHEKFSNTLSKLLELKAIPIINENDTVSTEEIVIGDNDTLGAIVAKSVDADLLIVISDIDGLYTSDPRNDPDAKLIREVDSLDSNKYALAGGSGTKFGTGGMLTKFEAAKICAGFGCEMIIVNGKNPNNIYDAIEGKPVGTRFKVNKNV